MLSSKDINFVGYTYKNFEIINDHQLPGIGIFFLASIIFIQCILSIRVSYLVFCLHIIQSVESFIFYFFHSDIVILR